MLATFLLLSALGFLAGLAWVPWWGVASVAGANAAPRRRTAPRVR